MSEDTNLFKPPPAYPQPPKDMYYEVPRERPAPAVRPKPIFPWEVNQAPATRVFAEDKTPSPEPIARTQEGLGLPPLETGDGVPQGQPDSTTTTPTIQVSEHQPFSSYQRTNAWDEMPEIQRYMEGFALSRRGARRTGGRHTPSSSLGSVITSPPGEGPAERRPSLRLTDFPTELERPSLPVTPAPIRRPSFWGEERDNQGELPAADGVPPQQDWDPLKKLEELQRRQSEVFISGTMTPTKIPQRELPGVAMPPAIKEDLGLGIRTPASTGRSSASTVRTAGKPSFATEVKTEQGSPSSEQATSTDESSIWSQDTIKVDTPLIRRANIEEESRITEEVIVREGSTITKQFTYEDGSTATEQYSIKEEPVTTEYISSMQEPSARMEIKQETVNSVSAET